MDVTVDEIIYLASEFAGDQEQQYKGYLDSLIGVWKSLQNASSSIVKRE